MNTRKFQACALAGASLFLAGLFVPSQAAAEPSDTEGRRADVVHAAPANTPKAELDGLSKSDRAGLARTQLLSPTFEELQAIDGFVDGGFKKNSQTLKVYWNGPLSAEAQDVLARAEARGLNTEVITTELSAELFDVALDQLAGDLAKAKIPFRAVGSRSDYTALTVSGPALDVSAPLRRRVADIAAQSTPEIPVVILPWGETDDTPLAFNSRRDDEGDYNVGNVVGPTTYGGCTSGLPLYRAGYGHYLVTAAHCSEWANGTSMFNPNGRRIGTTSWVPELWGPKFNAGSGPWVDATLIPIASPDFRTTGTMFVGSSTTSNVEFQYGAGTIPTNTSLCSSGGATGTNCGFERTGNAEITCANENCTMKRKTVRVDVTASDPDKIAFGEGDSGGPIYYLNASGHRVITALVQGGAGPYVSCSTYYSSAAICSHYNGRVTAVSSILSILPDSYIVNKTN